MNKKITSILFFLFLFLGGGYVSSYGSDDIFPYILPSSEVSQVIINYGCGGMMVSVKHGYIINRINGKFMLNQAKDVGADKIASLISSLVNLQESGGSKSCENHTDDYPGFNIEIGYQNSDKIVIYSDSNCHNNIPWNIIIGNKLYVQYTGEIPDALFSLLKEIDPDNWGANLNRPIQVDSDYGFMPFPIISDKMPEGIKRVSFSEKELYRKTLSENIKFNIFMLSHKFVDLELDCWISEKNPDCSEINGVVTAVSLIGDYKERIPVKFKGHKLVEFGVVDNQKIIKKIKAHPLVKNIMAANLNISVVIDYSVGKVPFNNYANVLLALSTPVSAQCSPYSIRFEDWDAALSNDFIYFPEADRIWVKDLHLGPQEFHDGRIVLGLDNVLKLFKVEGYEIFKRDGYEVFFEENIIDFEVQTCHRIMAYFKQNALQQNPGYIVKLKEKFPDLTNYENRVDIYGFCIFVDKNGHLEPIKSK